MESFCFDKKCSLNVKLNLLIHWIEIENSIQQGPLPGRERLVDRTVNAIVFFNVLCCEQLFLASTLTTTTTTLLLYIIRCRYFTPNIPHQKLIVKIDDGFSLLSSFNLNSNYSLSSSSYTNTEWAGGSGKNNNNNIIIDDNSKKVEHYFMHITINFNTKTLYHFYLLDIHTRTPLVIKCQSFVCGACVHELYL